MKFGVGQAVPRTEDPRLLTGRGRYVDDIRHPDQAYAVFVRAPLAHARFEAPDLAEARAAPGVLAVLSFEDEEVRALRPILPAVRPTQPDGSQMPAIGQPHLAQGRALYVGQPVAMVIADSPARARDAAELIAPDYEELSPLPSPGQALAPDAPQLHDKAPGNIAYRWRVGDEKAADNAINQAAHKVSLSVMNTRIIVNSLEPRMINAAYDADSERWLIHCASQGTHSIRAMLAGALGLEESRFRVLTQDVGGGFGMKFMEHPEYALCALAARRLNRPVKWSGDRSEAFLSDTQGRDLKTEITGGFDEEGRLQGLRLSSIANLGAYPSTAGAGCATEFSGDLAAAIYKTEHIFNEVRGIYTTTTPVDAYRGAGRPEITYIIERLMDKAAFELGLDQAEIRRRNLRLAEEMPYKTPLGVRFECGDFQHCLEKALERADWAGFETRREEAKARGRILGRGLICYMERTGGGPVENARIQILPDDEGKARIWVGTQSTGQGHETVFAQLVHEKLGLPLERIEMLYGDSDLLEKGGGTGGSRSLIMGGRVFLKAADDVVEKARERAAEHLEAAQADIEFRADQGGLFRIKGTDRAVSLFDLAQSGEILGAGGVDNAAGSYPNGCHISEIELDPQTGEIALVRYTALDDFGVALNPLLLEGQMHGGIAQGIGEALMEGAAFDLESGQPITASFMDYAMPRANDLCDFDFNYSEHAPSPGNPLGVKGCGESGTVAAAPCILAAALDALRGLGVEEIDMPLAPGRVWRAIEEARRADHG